MAEPVHQLWQRGCHLDRDKYPAIRCVRKYAYLLYPVQLFIFLTLASIAGIGLKLRHGYRERKEAQQRVAVTDCCFVGNKLTRTAGYMHSLHLV